RHPRAALCARSSPPSGPPRLSPGAPWHPPPEPVRYHRRRRPVTPPPGAIDWGHAPRAATAAPASVTMHTLVFLDPGHFHAALTLRERHPLVRDEIVVYAPPAGGPELAEFLTLVEAFNRRPERPTRWQTVVRTDADPLARLLKDRPGDVAILAGRNDRKMALARQLHDAGLHVLADKPWLTSAVALPDVRHVLSGGARVMEMMTGRHAATSSVANRLVGDRDIFGAFATGDDAPAIRLASVHHLEKVVNGAPLRRPAWDFDVR